MLRSASLRASNTAVFPVLLSPINTVVAPITKSSLVIPLKFSISRRRSCILRGKDKFVNANLGGHQFVQEGAEEDLETRLFRKGVSRLLVEEL